MSPTSGIEKGCSNDGGFSTARTCATPTGVVEDDGWFIPIGDGCDADEEDVVAEVVVSVDGMEDAKVDEEDDEEARVEGREE